MRKKKQVLVHFEIDYIIRIVVMINEKCKTQFFINHVRLGAKQNIFLGIGFFKWYYYNWEAC